MVTARLEPLCYLLLHGLPDLAFECWQELEHEHVDEPYNPDWERYQRMENTDGLRFFALREDEHLIGYASIVITADEHRANILQGNFNDIFIAKPKRGHAAFLVKYVEKTMVTLGVKRTVVSEKVNVAAINNAGEFFERIGYVPQEIIYAKVLH